MITEQLSHISHGLATSIYIYIYIYSGHWFGSLFSCSIFCWGEGVIIGVKESEGRTLELCIHELGIGPIGEVQIRVSNGWVWYGHN